MNRLITVLANGEVFKNIKTKSENDTMFYEPIEKADYWKAQYDINRATHSVEKKNKTWEIRIDPVDSEYELLPDVGPQLFTTREAFYEYLKPFVKGYVERTPKVAKEKKVKIIDLTKVKRNDLVNIAKKAKLKGYSDMNMKTIADKLVALNVIALKEQEVVPAAEVAVMSEAVA